MAKRKGAVALFEVIHKDKRFARPNPSALSTPAWWFKGKLQKPPAPPPPGNTTPPLQTIADPPPLQLPLAAPVAPDESHPHPQRLTPNEKDSWPALAAGKLGPMEAAPRPHHLDRLVGGNFTWTSGAIIGASVVVVIILGVMFTHHPQRAAADNQTPLVVNITPGPGETFGQPPAKKADDLRPPPPQRQRGLFYALIQWYPDEKTAQAASDLLNASGIPNTLETNLRLPEIPRESIAVVGLEGFTHTRNSDCRSYQLRIRQISTEFDKPGSFRSFRPIMFQWWRGPEPRADSAPRSADQDP
ncbi:MAG TPA: hypothetical protein VMD30_00005 [Tepidisphaeraceae bacterium]|nr:hypothetical protein [Tepidisphaeraceae bacterium]